MKILPLFLPYCGCKTRCIFCNQEILNGNELIFDKHEIPSILRNSISGTGDDFQIAFFGGTFTGLELEEQEELLSYILPYLKHNNFKGLRISTMPDRITLENITLLKKYHLHTVELGVETLNTETLKFLKRAYHYDSVMGTVNLLKSHKVSTVAQLMVGLPGEDEDLMLCTARKVIELGFSAVRIHPTLVLNKTELETLYQSGEYIPLSLENSVRICARITVMMIKRGIEVIRLGLLHTKSLMAEGNIIAGPFHARFGELVKSFIYHNALQNYLHKKFNGQEKIIMGINPREISKMTGDGNSNINSLKKNLNLKNLIVQTDNSLGLFEIHIKFPEKDKINVIEYFEPRS